MNARAKKTVTKIDFFSAFIESCLNLNFYARASKASWLHIILHGLVLVLLITIAYSFASYNLLVPKLNGLLKDTPTIKIKNGQAEWKQDLELPYIKKFPPNASKKLYYIMDSGENRAALEEKYNNYVLFTKKTLILNDGRNRKEIPLDKLENDPVLTNSFFGNPLTLSPPSLSRFIAFYTVLLLGALFLFLPLLVLFPLFNLLAALIANIAGKWNISFPNIVKLAFFAATPTCLIQIVGCFFLVLNWTIFLIGLFISWSIQIAYLITGLKVYKLSSQQPPAS